MLRYIFICIYLFSFSINFKFSGQQFKQQPVSFSFLAYQFFLCFFFLFFYSSSRRQFEPDPFIHVRFSPPPLSVFRVVYNRRLFVSVSDIFRLFQITVFPYFFISIFFVCVCSNSQEKWLYMLRICRSNCYIAGSRFLNFLLTLLSSSNLISLYSQRLSFRVSFLRNL